MACLSGITGIVVPSPQHVYCVQKTPDLNEFERNRQEESGANQEDHEIWSPDKAVNSGNDVGDGHGTIP